MRHAAVAPTLFCVFCRDTGRRCRRFAFPPSLVTAVSCACMCVFVFVVGVLDVQIKGEKKQMTNAEWMDLIYPTNEDLPYMYDQFNWDHCR